MTYRADADEQCVWQKGPWMQQIQRANVTLLGTASLSLRSAGQCQSLLSVSSWSLRFLLQSYVTALVATEGQITHRSPSCNFASSSRIHS